MHRRSTSAGVILAEEPQRRGECVQLVVDVGTNAEIVGVGGRSWPPPAPAAFEGAGSLAGSARLQRRSSASASTRRRWNRASGSCAALWVRRARFAEAMDGLAISGICTVPSSRSWRSFFLGGGVTADGVIDGALAAPTPRLIADGRAFAYVLHDGQPRLVIAHDVRAIQLAKAAYAGARLLMVAPAWTASMRSAWPAPSAAIEAMVLGLVPDCDPAHVVAAGNTAAGP